MLVTMTPWTLQNMQSRLAELDGSASDADPHKARARHAILDAASANFVRHGYRKASIDDIARDAGVGKGTIYLYFDSKATLLVAAVAREKLGLLPEVGAAMARPEAERLEAFIAMTLRFALTAPLSGMLLRGDPELLRQLRAATPDTEADEARDLALALELLSGAGVDEDPREVLARILLSVLPLAAHLVDASARLGVDLDTFIALYARTLARGLMAAGQPPAQDDPA